MKITALPAEAAVALADLIAVVENATTTTKKATIAQLRAALLPASLTADVSGVLPVDSGGTNKNLAALVGQALKFFQVNAGETGYQFATVSSPSVTGSGFWKSILGVLQAAASKVDLTAAADVTVPATANGVARVSGSALTNSANFTEDGSGNAVLASTLSIGGGTYATAGLLRFANNKDIVAAENGAASGVINALGVSSSDIVMIGLNVAGTRTAAQVTIGATGALNLSPSGNVLVQPGGGTTATFSTTFLTMATPIDLGASQYLTIGGGTVHTTAKIRLPYPGAGNIILVGHKDSTATDRGLVKLGPADAWTLGDAAKVLDLTIYGAALNLNGTAINPSYGSGNFTLGSLVSGGNAIVATSTTVGIGFALQGDATSSATFHYTVGGITFTASSDYTLSAAEAACPIIQCFPFGGGEGPRNVIAPTQNGAVICIDNKQVSSAVTLKKSGGTGFAIAAGKKAWGYYNGSDYVRLTPDA